MSRTLEQIAQLTPEKKRALLAQLLREKASQSSTIPLSFAQQRLWFLDKLEPNSPAYNVPTVVKLHGKLLLEPLRQALNSVVTRHEVLRTTFHSVDDHPFQRINAPRPVEFPFIDLSHLDRPTREKEAERIITEESRRPFDLAHDLMARAVLFRLEPEEHILLLITHHIASDEWSLRTIYHDWAAYYQAACGQEELKLPELPIQYSDFAQWQRNWLKTDNYQQQLAYWKKQLQDRPPALQLPTDRPRPSSQTYRGALYPAHYSTDLIERARHFSRTERVTLFMTLLAAFKVLLYKYTGQEDLIVGSPIAGRNRMELEPLVGFFVNTLALRTKISGDPTFREVLKQVREMTLGAYAHQDMPFDKLVEELHPERSSTHMPFVQVVFSLNNEFVQEQPFPGVRSENLEVDTGTAKFDLTFIAKDTPEGLSAFIEYNSDLFDTARIDRLLSHYRVLLESVVTNPDQRLSQIVILTPLEEKQALSDWNQTDTEFARHECIHHLFEHQVARRPDAEALKYGPARITYRELNAQANQLAHRLQKMKVGPNTLVGVYMDRSIEMITAFLAILKTGAAYVPLDLSYPRHRIAFMIQDTAMPVILTQSSRLAELPGEGVSVLALDTEWPSISEEPRQIPPNRSSPEDLAYIIYTSGSTGKPKGVAVPHLGVTRLVLNTNYISINPGDRLAQASNASFDAATFEIWGALLNGGTVVGFSKEVSISPADFVQELRSKQINTLFLTTALFNQLAREIPGAFESLTNVLFGGEAVDPKWVRAVLECKPPKRLLHVYGPTESTTFSSWYLVQEVSEEAATVPIGRPISNTQIYLLDPHLKPVPVGIPGEVYVGGDGLARGYWNRPELTAEKFVPNPFHSGSRLYRTGDLGRYDAEGNIEFIGRLDQQVKLRGFRIELGEVESSLARHPGVSNVVILVREDVPGDRRLVAYIIPNGEPPSITDLRTHLKSELPDYMVPSAFVFMDAFPLTPNEKVDRKSLPVPEQNRPELSKTFIAPRDHNEQQLAKIWEKILGVQPIGVADNFFELGGHSLLAVRLFSQIEKAFNQKLPLATLFRAPTIEQLAAILRKGDQAQPWSTIVDIQPSGSRPPMFWIHSLGGDGGGGFFYYRKLAELLGEDQPSFGVRSPQKPLPTIPEMAEFYISEIRRFSPKGPYCLGGFCFGGIVAYEIARRLTLAGQTVGVLALMESSAPNLPLRDTNWSPASALHSLENLVENVKDFVSHSPQEQIAYVKKKSGRLRQKLREKIGVETAAPKVELKEVLDLTTYPRDYVKYAETHWQALTQYTPEPYNGSIHLFRAKKQGLSNFNHTLGWEGLVGDRVNVTVIPGTHESMLQEPNVQILAAQLRSLLDAALENKVVQVPIQ